MSQTIRQLTPNQQGIFKRRLKIVRRWLRIHAETRLNNRAIRDAMARYLVQLAASGNKISRATLHNWANAYRFDGPRGLLDERWFIKRSTGDQSADQQCAAFLAEMRRLYSGPGLLPMEACFWLARESAARHGWPIPTIRQAKRFIRREVLPSLTREPGLIERPSTGL